MRFDILVVWLFSQKILIEEINFWETVIDKRWRMDVSSVMLCFFYNVMKNKEIKNEWTQ